MCLIKKIKKENKQNTYSKESTTNLAGLSSTVKGSSVLGLELATKTGLSFPSSQM